MKNKKNPNVKFENKQKIAQIESAIKEDIQWALKHNQEINSK